MALNSRSSIANKGYSDGRRVGAKRKTKSNFSDLPNRLVKLLSGIFVLILSTDLDM